MPAYTWDEMTDSGSGTIKVNDPTSQRKFLLAGLRWIDDIIAAIVANLPPYNLVAEIPQFLRNYKYDIKGNGNIVEVTGDYGNTPNYWELSGDMPGAKTKLLTAITTLNAYDCSGNIDPGTGVQVLPPDCGNLIGINKDKVEGVEVGLPSFDFAINYKLKFTTLPAGYLQTLRQVCWHTNASAFQIIYKGQIMTFTPESLLYMGGPFKTDSNDETELTFKFSAQQPKLGGTATTAAYTQPLPGGTADITVFTTAYFSVGQTIYLISNGGITGGAYIVTNIASGTVMTLQNIGLGTGVLPIGTSVSLEPDPIVVGASGAIAKKGWHYLWSYAEPRLDATTRRTIPKPIAAYVQQVYPTADFSLLNIGTNVDLSGLFPQ